MSYKIPTETEALIERSREKSGGEVVPGASGDYIAICTSWEKDHWSIYPVSGTRDDGVATTVIAKDGKDVPVIAISERNEQLLIAAHRLADPETLKALCWKRYRGLTALRNAVKPHAKPKAP